LKLPPAIQSPTLKRTTWTLPRRVHSRHRARPLPLTDAFPPILQERKAKGRRLPLSDRHLSQARLPPTPVKGNALTITKGVPKEYNSAAKIISLLEDFAVEHSVLTDVSDWLEEAWKRKVNTSILGYTDDRPSARSRFRP
jgi:hypothetical protein